MTIRSFARRVIAVVVTAAFVGCGGHAGTTLLPHSAGGSSSGGSTPASVTVRVTIPAAAVATMRNRRAPQFVSPSTNGVLVNVYAASDITHTTLLGSSATDISSGSAACGGTVGTPRTCTVAIPAPVGNDAFVFTTYDAAPSGGSFTGAKQLAAGLVTQMINANSANTVNVTLGGVVSSVSLALTTPNIHGTGQSTQVLTVAALDPDGNTIISDGYVDANGNPVTIALSQKIINATALGGSGTTTATGANGGTVTLATASLGAPSSSGVQLTYDGGANLPTCASSPCDGSFNDTITAAPSNGVTPATVKLQTLGPKLIEYPVLTANAQPFGIASGPGGQLWFTESAASNLASITTGGVVSEFPVNPGPLGVAAGSDGNLWFADFACLLVGGMSPGGAIVNHANTVSQPWGITSGPDGNLWFTEAGGGADQVGTVTTAGALTEYPTTTPSAFNPSANVVNGIAAGSDGRLWFAESSGNAIGAITTGGTITEYRTGLSALAVPSGIAAGLDGNLWFTEFASDKIGKITINGTISEYSSGLSSGAGPSGITAGADGNVWFTEQNANKIGRINLTTGAISEYPIVTSSSQPIGITSGPDGNLWFVEFSGNNIGEFLW